MNNLNTKISITLLLLSQSIIGLWANEQVKTPWWHPQWEYRLPLTIENKGEIALKKRPFVITGKEFFHKTGLKNIRTSSFRLVSKGKAFPIQVDEKDGTGLYQSSPNYMLDMDDEIIMQVSIPACGKVDFYLYASSKILPFPDFKGNIKIDVCDNPLIGQLRIGNPVLDFIVKGPGALDKGIYGKHGCASITFLRVKGVEMVHFKSNVSQCLPTFKSSQVIGYSIPEVVIDGLLRKTVMTTYKGHHRYFSCYNAVDLLEMTDVYKYSKKWPEEFKRQLYTNQYSPGIFDRDNELLVPLVGKTTTIKMSEVKSSPGQSEVFYKTSVPEEGWFAWFNNSLKIGLAVFFQKDSSVKIKATSFDKSLGKPSGSPSNLITINIPNLAQTRKFWTTRITYAGIDSPNQAKAYYKFHTNPLVTFGFVEEWGK